jgi:hypothetical protein
MKLLVMAGASLEEDRVEKIVKFYVMPRFEEEGAELLREIPRQENLREGHGPQRGTMYSPKKKPRLSNESTLAASP